MNRKDVHKDKYVIQNEQKILCHFAIVYLRYPKQSSISAFLRFPPLPSITRWILTNEINGRKSEKLLRSFDCAPVMLPTKSASDIFAVHRGSRRRMKLVFLRKVVNRLVCMCLKIES